MPEISAAFLEKLEKDKPLAPFTTFKTGGSAKYFIAVKSVDELSGVIKGALQNSLDFIIIGGGSNLLISDNGYDGLIIKIDIKGLSLEDDTHIRSGSGELLMDLVNFATKNSLSGLEFASGIYGFVGGAICGNAGAYGGEIKDILEEITLVDKNGEIKKVTVDYCKFSYRNSYLKESGEIVTEALFRLTNGDKKAIEERVNEIVEIRSGKHPVSGMSAGSFFKNIPDASQPYGKLPAGKLLEEVGVKGLKVGGAQVYEKHANMIVNTGNATSKDIRELADIMKRKVFEKFNIELEEEVVSIGEF